MSSSFLATNWLTSGISDILNGSSKVVGVRFGLLSDTLISYEHDLVSSLYQNREKFTVVSLQ